jgi:hypothetical protein
METKPLTIILVVIVCVFMFPILIGAIGGFFGLIGGLLGGLFGLIGGLFGMIFGAIGQVIGATAGFFGWLFGSLFNFWDWNWGFHLSPFSILIIAVVVILLARSRQAKRTSR